MNIQALHKAIHDDTLDVLRRKNNDYTVGKGEADVFANFKHSEILGISAGTGIMVRMIDKHQRIRTFVTKGTLQVLNESVRDAIMDLHNYTALLHGWHHGCKTLEQLIEVRKILYDNASTLLVNPLIPEIPDLLSKAEQSMSSRVDTIMLLAIYTKIAYKIQEIQK